MADNDKAKTAKERLAAAKKAAEDAEVVAENAADKIGDAATETASAVDAAQDAAADTVEAATDAAEAEIDKIDADAQTAPGSDAETKTTSDDAETELTDAADPKDDAKPEEAPAGATPGEAAAAPVPPPQKPARPWSAVALQWIVLFLAGIVFALFAAPRVAPYLPASVADLVSPRGDGLEEALSAARAENEAAIAALTERLDAAEAEIAAQAETAEAARADMAAALEPRIAAAEAAKTDTTDFEAAVDDVAGRVTQAEAALEGLKAEVSDLAGFTGESAAPSAETLERVAAFGASVEGLRAEVAALSEATAGIDRAASNADLAALADRVEALEGGQAATAGAEEEARRIRGSAQLDAALTRINRALISGDSFAEQLAAAETLSGAEVPAGLAAAAETGTAPIDALARRFETVARDGYAAALKADAGDGLMDGVLASVQGQLGGRPSVETEGEDVGAVLSRIEARLRDGDAAAALAAADGLPDAAIGAMSGWLASLEKTANARAGFETFRAALTN
ncbi:MAG: hypothetical protein AAFN79_19290 [Pseudomonadota bacterium]